MISDDKNRIEHMLEAAQAARRFCEGIDQVAFQADEKTQRAVVQCLEVIGEAARHVSEPTRQGLASVPWHKIIGMRHRMIHAYFDIDTSLVWQVIERDLKPLIAALLAA